MAYSSVMYQCLAPIAFDYFALPPRKWNYLGFVKHYITYFPYADFVVWWKYELDEIMHTEHTPVATLRAQKLLNLLEREVRSKRKFADCYDGDDEGEVRSFFFS